MIVQDIMTTKLVTVGSDDTLVHAANLLRRYQFHHLPVVRKVQQPIDKQNPYQIPPPLLIFQGLLTREALDLAIAQAEPEKEGHPEGQLWQERRVSEVMSIPEIWVSPTTSVAAAAQLLVERGITSVPVIETDQKTTESRALLVGLLTRSDLLLALARSLGADEPGTHMTIQLPANRMAPLARALLAADELHIDVHSILVAPHEQHRPRLASLHLRTIHLGPLLIRLKQEGISYRAGDSLEEEGEVHA